MSKKLIAYLKTRIEETGYPLEIEISGMLDAFWDVSHIEIYLDRVDNKVRDIDIGAYHWFHFDNFELATELAIECKKNQTFAWVFSQFPNPKRA